MRSINYNWFKGVLADRRMSQRRLAAAMHLDPSTINLMLRGQRRMQMSEAAEIARLLETPLEDVLQNAGIDVPEGALPGEKKINVIGYVDRDSVVHREKIRGTKLAPAPPGPRSGRRCCRRSRR